MTSIMTIAQRHRLLVVEDAAQGLIASIDGAALGSVGDFGTLSFHETKNVNCGRGGALLVNNPEFAMGTELAMENGCDRAKFHRGEVSRYTWRTLGSSFQMGELSAAYLSAQLEHAAEITEQRLRVWASYHEMLCGLESEGWLTRPQISTRARHNGHIYYVMLAPGMDRDRVLQATARQGIECSSHFVPLHDSPAGAKYGRTHGPMTVSNDIAARIVRLPLWPGMNLQQVMRVVETLASVVRGAACSNDRPALV